MKSQKLQMFESLTQQFLTSMTNQAYSRGFKLAYKMSWEKGQGTIDNGEGGRTKSYWIFKMYLIDKTLTPVGKKVELYVNFYPTKGVLTNEVLLTQAYYDLFLNGIQSLVNVSYALILEREKSVDYTEVASVTIDEKVEALRESAKGPGLITDPTAIGRLNNTIPLPGNANGLEPGHYLK